MPKHHLHSVSLLIMGLKNRSNERRNSMNKTAENTWTTARFCVVWSAFCANQSQCIHHHFFYLNYFYFRLIHSHLAHWFIFPKNLLGSLFKPKIVFFKVNYSWFFRLSIRYCYSEHHNQNELKYWICYDISQQHHWRWHFSDAILLSKGTCKFNSVSNLEFFPIHLINFHLLLSLISVRHFTVDNFIGDK